MKHCLFLLLFLVPPVSLHAQSLKKDSVGLNRELTLEREYNPVLEDASKINRLPEIKEPEAPKSKVEFSNYTFPLTVPPYLHLLNSGEYLTELTAYGEKGYLNLGLGSLLNLDGDLGYQLLNTNRNTLNLYASHRSSNSNVTYLQNSREQKMKLNDNYGGFNFRHLSSRIQFDTRAKYTASSYNYYGKTVFPPSLSSIHLVEEPADASDKNTAQQNDLLEIHAGILSREQSDLYFKVTTAYTFFRQKYGHLNTLKGPTENRFITEADLYASFNSTTGIGIAASMKNYIGSDDYTTFSFNPYFTFEGDNWNSRLGASANVQAGGIEKFILAPDIRFYWTPAEKSRFYAVFTGGIRDNSHYVSFYENRYIDPAFRICDSKSPFDAVVGFELSPVPNTSLDLFAGYKWVYDEHFYITGAMPENPVNGTPLAGQRIIPLYLDAQTGKLGGIFKYVYPGIFDLNLKLTYYKWNIDKLSGNINDDAFSSLLQPQAWNKPQWEADLSLAFQIPAVPVYFNLLYHGEWERKAFVSIDPVAMKDIHDLSFRGTYPLNRMFSVYATMNNLLFQKYDFLYGYPAQSFNIMGGVNIKF